MCWFKREFISRTYNLLEKLIVNTKYSDAQCGFKAVNKQTLQKLLPHLKDNEWFLDTELLTMYEIAKSDRIIYNNKQEIKKVTGMTNEQLDKLVSMGALDAMSDGSLAIRLDFNWEGGGK